MEITLVPELQNFIEQKVAAGEYPSASEVVNVALRQFQEKQAEGKWTLEDLRREVMIGVEQTDRGEAIPLDGEAIKAEGRRILALRSGK